MSLELMKKRMEHEGGATSDGRNVKAKWFSFNAALWNSYQAEWITFKDEKCRCLINPDKLKENYDQKEISIDFKYGMKNGDVFYWDRTNTYWLVYLQRYEEEAYFRAQLRRCDYEIDVNGTPYRVYLRGPVETALIWRQKHQIEFNELNYSILFYITKNEETLDYFSRLKVLKFDGHNWRVAATDKYSQDGVIEVYLEEYFDNSMKDLMEPIQEIEVDEALPHIKGPQIVHPYDTDITYTIEQVDESGIFKIDSKKVKITKNDKDSCTLDIVTGKSGTFKIIYSIDGIHDVSLDVTIDSL